MTKLTYIGSCYAQFAKDFAAQQGGESNSPLSAEQEPKIYSHHWRQVTPQDNDGLGWKFFKVLGMIFTFGASLAVAAILGPSEG